MSTSVTIVTMAARLVQLNRSSGGMPKIAIAAAEITLDGVSEDWQLNRKYHGGRERAICLFSIELYDWLNQTLGTTLKPGDVGENFTTAGIDLDMLSPNDRLRVGACTIQIAKVREPCKQLNHWHPRLLPTMLGRSGWMARVLEPATVSAGDAIFLETKP